MKIDKQLMRDCSHVKKSFEHKERMWVKINIIKDDGIIGTLSNKPWILTSVKRGDLIFVPYEEVVDVKWKK